MEHNSTPIKKENKTWKNQTTDIVFAGTRAGKKEQM
jgi:hypothetical protein